MGLADIRIYIRQLATMNYEHFAYETLRLLLGHFANCIQYSSPTVTVRIDAGYSYGCRIYGNHAILDVHV